MTGSISIEDKKPLGISSFLKLLLEIVSTVSNL